MQRLYTKNATGVAPDGRWYAGDVNALQDAVAAANDLTQVLGLGTLQIGETGLQLLRYGAGEARLSGLLRVDGILRGLGGLYAGAFTTTQRDAIAAGSRPYGLIILNTTTNRLEFNAGTDPAPNWRPLNNLVQLAEIVTTGSTPGDILTNVGGVATWQTPAPGVASGLMFDFGGPEANVPAGYLPCDGRILAQAGYAALYAAIGNNWNLFGGQADPGVGNFRVPKLNGLGTIGARNMGGGAGVTGSVARAAAILFALLGEEYHTLSLAELASHNHGGITGNDNVDHTHTLTTGTESADHGHAENIQPYSGGQTYGHNNLMSDANAANQGGPFSFGTTGGRNTAHSHSGTSAGRSTVHQHSVSSAGSGSAHENVHPVAVVEKIIKT